MIFHNKYTMNLNTYSLLSETGNMKYLNKLRLWLPKKINDKAYIDFMKGFNESFTKKNNNKLVDESTQLYMFHRAFTYLPLMYQILLVDTPKKVGAEFELIYKKKPIFENLECLKNDIDRLQIKYKQMYADAEIKEEPKEPTATIKFEEIIRAVERILDNGNISRKLKIYQFEVYHIDAVKIK